VELRLRMQVFPTVEATTWEFIMVVDGFQTEEMANTWMQSHRESLVDETLLKLPAHFPPKKVGNAAWRRSILEAEGLGDWTLEIKADAYCWLKDHMIQLPPNASPSLFLHEVAHALHPEPEGPMKNHYHGGGWAAAFGRLVDKYLVAK
jgi:hypothetical protein